jgi:hypothetical protein
MPSFEVNFEVFCAKCGAGICNLADGRNSRGRGEPQVTVAPCENCLDAARSEGADEKESEKDAEIAALEDSHADEVRALSDTIDALRIELADARALA